MREEAFFFDCDGDALLGVLARPAEPSAVGVVIVVGGPQYRVGSHRHFVLLARRLATAGHPTLRFDVPLSETLDDLRYRGPERIRLRAVCEEVADFSLLEGVTPPSTS